YPCPLTRTTTSQRTKRYAIAYRFCVSKTNFIRRTAVDPLRLNGFAAFSAQIWRNTMKKRLLSILLAMIMALSILPTTSMAADSVEEALGEIDIYNGGTELSYLMINGRVRTLIYTYYNYVNAKGETREIPAYCVNPNIYGVPQTVGVGESIEYLAEEKTSDPKVLGIVASGYPTRSLEELGLENKYQGYYATKMALWCYLLSNWDINNLKVNSSLTGV